MIYLTVTLAIAVVLLAAALWDTRRTLNACYGELCELTNHLRAHEVPTPLDELLGEMDEARRSGMNAWQWLHGTTDD